MLLVSGLTKFGYTTFKNVSMFIRKIDRYCYESSTKKAYSISNYFIKKKIKFCGILTKQHSNAGFVEKIPKQQKNYLLEGNDHL